MFETVLERRQRLQRAVREFIDLSACRVFTVRQQILWALACGAIGVAASVAVSVRAAAWELEHNPPTPPTVTLLDPVIERFETDYSVYRFRFEVRGIELWCHGVFWNGTGKWTVKCWRETP